MLWIIILQLICKNESIPTCTFPLYNFSTAPPNAFPLLAVLWQLFSHLSLFLHTAIYIFLNQYSIREWSILLHFCFPQSKSAFLRSDSPNRLQIQYFCKFEGRRQKVEGILFRFFHKKIAWCLRSQALERHLNFLSVQNLFSILFIFDIYPP